MERDNRRFYFFANIALFVVATLIAFGIDALDNDLDWFFWLIPFWLPILLIHGVYFFQVWKQVVESGQTHINEDSVASPPSNAPTSDPDAPDTTKHPTF